MIDSKRGRRAMHHAPPSALVTDSGQRVLFRLNGRLFELSLQELRNLLGVPQGPAGLGITIDGERIQFEFAGDAQSLELTASQLQAKLRKRVVKMNR